MSPTPDEAMDLLERVVVAYHMQHHAGLYKPGFDDCREGFCEQYKNLLVAQPKAPSPSEYGPLIPSLGPIKMPEPDQELPPFYTKPPAGEGV